jgi:type II secretory pathway component PulL
VVDLFADPSRILSLTAAVLLVFVSISVVYLSSVEWRDRRRRKQQERQSRP